MIQTLDDFSSATAFERLLLDRLFPLFHDAPRDEIDLGTLGQDEQVVIKTSLVVSLFGQQSTADRKALLPLLFGAAWKILDLLIELGLSHASMQPKRHQWTIAEKVDHARSHATDACLLGTDPPVWQALERLYANTAEHRHCLVHRTLIVQREPSRISGRSASGDSLKPLTAAELEAIVACVQLAAITVLAGGATTRDSLHLKYALDQLREHTEADYLNGVKAAPPVLVRARLAGTADEPQSVGLGWLKAQAQRRVPRTAYDLRLEWPTAACAIGGWLEDMPGEILVLDLARLPSYLHIL